MTLRAALIALLTLPTLAVAQSLPPLSADPPEQQQDEGAADLIGRGLGRILDQLLTEMQPDLDRLGPDMSGALSRLAPVLSDLSVLIDDLANYQAPERLGNGDVLIRRKPGAPPPPPVGDALRGLTAPDNPAAPGGPAPPVDPTRPEITL